MLETTRLKLVPLTHDLLLLYKHHPQQLSKALSINHLDRMNDPSVENEISEAFDFWLEKTKAHPDRFEWYTNWEIVLKQDMVAIGGIGFSADPKINNGKSMVGYGLDVRFFGQGYATEALSGILYWGFESGLDEAVADTPVNHLASQRVLVKNGFIEQNREEQIIHWSLKR
jgi:[ribosomal protein S5]-alanine N-acetyltransferase